MLSILNFEAHFKGYSKVSFNHWLGEKMGLTPKPMVKKYFKVSRKMSLKIEFK